MNDFVFLLGLGLFCYGGYMLWLQICRPEQYEAMQRRRAERFGRTAGGVLGGIVRGALGITTKNKPH